MLDEKADGIATSSATKAFVELLRLGYGEGRSLFIMERAKSQMAIASAFQLDELSHDIDDIDAVQYFLYGVLCDQEREVTKA
jgi:hypothetical protein